MMPAARVGTSKSNAANVEIERQAAALYEALSDFIRVYQFRDRDRICCHDISVAQCYAMESLARQGPLTLNALATEMYLDKSTTSRIIAALERKGYVRRRSHPRDGRAVLLELKPKGQVLYARIRAGLLEEERRLLEGFPPTVRGAAVRLIARLAEAAATRACRARKGDPC